MSDPRVRWQIARRAAQLMYERTESEYFTAKRKAAREMGIDHRYRPRDLPSNSEIRDQIQILADLMEGETRAKDLRDMRLAALRLMRELAPFRPHLIGSVLTGHIRKGSDIDIHVFPPSPGLLLSVLEEMDLQHTVEQKRILKHNEERLFTHVHIDARFPIELTVYAASQVNYPFKSSITHKTIERASTAQLEALLRETYPGIDLEAELDPLEDHADPLDLIHLLLAPLESVKQSAVHHPEGDALYHTLQVFELARDAKPWDEEFLLAALLHDVGKAIDPHDHVTAGLLALEGAITPRTAFLIAHHMDAHQLADGKLGARARRRLEASEDFDDLMLLQQLDRQGRQRGVEVCTIDEALQFIRELRDESDGLL